MNERTSTKQEINQLEKPELVRDGIESHYRLVMKRLNNEFDSSNQKLAATSKEPCANMRRFLDDNCHNTNSVMKKKTGCDSSQSFDISDVRNYKRKSVHMKSLSGDSEYLYTDFLISSTSPNDVNLNKAATNHVRSKKIATSVSRSSSLQHGHEKCSNKNSSRDLEFRKISDESVLQAIGGPVESPLCDYHGYKRQTFSLIPTPLVSEKQSVTTQQETSGRRVQVNWNISSAVDSQATPSEATTKVVDEMSHTPSIVPSSIYTKQQNLVPGNTSGNNPSSHFSTYSIMTRVNQGSPNQNFLVNTPSLQQQQAPVNHTGLYQNPRCDCIIQSNNISNETLHQHTALPQRPNTLAVGQNTKNVNEHVNANSFTSPSINMPSPGFNSHKICGPHRNNNQMFYINEEKDAILTPTYSTNIFQHPKQKSGASNSSNQIVNSQQQYSRCSGSSGNIVSTALTTPSFSDYNICDHNVRSSNLNQSFNQSFPRQPMSYDVNYSIQASVGQCKPEMTGISSACKRRVRSTANSQYRNSGSFGYSSAGSGSSSNSGSRPNSHADDFPNPSELEIENLKYQLSVAHQKLKEMHKIEKSVQRINENYSCLDQSVNKREHFRNELEISLRKEIETLENKNNELQEKISQLQVDLFQAKNNRLNIQSSVCRNDINAQSENNVIIHSYEATHRQIEEKNRQLEEEIEECRERMSEQSLEIKDLNNELQTSKEKMEKLKDQLEFHNSSKKWITAHQAKMETLEKVLNERIILERQICEELQQLQHHQQCNQVAQTPMMSVTEENPLVKRNSSNNLLQNLPCKPLAVQADKLKWQQVYLEKSLGLPLSDLQSAVPCFPNCMCKPPSSEQKPMRNHRHAVSDPCFDKLAEISFQLNSDGKSKNFFQNYGSAVDKSYEKKEDQELLKITPHNFINSHTSLTNQPRCTASSSRLQSQQPSTAHHQRHLNGEHESPASEGYHSQHSSGSPTPSGERSAPHFSVSSRDLHSDLQKTECHKSTDV